ncbi:MAG: DEAD/DEAH box helicase, partial [Candidatus Saccharibacteria bacterium]
SPSILKAIQEMGFESPTEVQNRAIPHVLNQEDVIVMSKTGSGKTAVFGVPLLQMIEHDPAGPQGLILTPTRELAVQVDSDLKRMAKHLPHHKTLAVYGQHNMHDEIQALNQGVSIVTGTPGRVFDHITHGNLKTKNIKFLVLDEADRMLDMGFFDQVFRIVRTLPRNRVTLLFSATIPPEVRKICRDYMKNPVTIEIESETKTVDTTEQVYYRVDKNEKNTRLNQLLLTELPESCVIFCNQKITVDKVLKFLDRKGYAVKALHGDIAQVRRSKTIQQFKQGKFHILVATDVAARGIHVDDLSLVINYDVPIEKDSYIHRIGRTGRSGNEGRAISLVTGDDIMTLYEIEEHIGSMIEEGEFRSEPMSSEHKALIEKWLQSNAQQRRAMGMGADSHAAGNQQKSHNRPPQHQEKQRERQPNYNNNQRSRTTAESQPRKQQAESGQAPPKPAPPRPSEPPVVHPKPEQVIPKAPAVAPQPTFFQRFLHRIFGQRRGV